MKLGETLNLRNMINWNRNLKKINGSTDIFRVRISRLEFAICEAFWQFPNEVLHFFLKLWIIEIRHFMNIQCYFLN